MSKNLPQIYKETFLKKVLQKIKMFFRKDYKKSNLVKSNPDTDIVEKSPQVKNNMLEDIKVDIKFSANTEFEKKSFMNNLTNHPELLENFSTDRLEKILQYYLDENEKKKELLKKISV